MSFRVKISTAVLILLLHFPISGFSPLEGYGQVSVKKWADDRKSAFTFTFDDGFISQYINVKPILDSFGFKGTFFIISGSMTDDLPGIWRYGTWNQFRSIALEGHEVGSHTITHPDLTTLTTGNISTSGTLLYELNQSKLTIEQKISNQKCITIAYPYNAYNTNVNNKTAQIYESGRGGSNVPMDSSLNSSGFYTIGAKEERFTTPRNSTQDDLDELQDIETYEQSSITDGKWGMLMAHEVVPYSQIADLLQQGSWFPMTTEWLTSLCQWLKQRSDSNQVWVETMGNITRYMKEREQFQYTITVQTATQIQINATDNLNDQIYNYPLTVDITVPPDWQAAIVIQGSRTDTINTITPGINSYVRTRIIPDGGILILNKTVKPTLPVEITIFTAGFINNGVHLNWKTATETNNSRFDIERMTGNNSWQNIGSIPGAGNSNSPKVYSFSDNSNLSSGKYFYRLKQVDFDGHFKYSNSIEVEINLVPQVYLLEQNYPNPFNPSTRIKYSIPFESNVRVTVFNALGEVVRELTNEMKGAGTYVVSFNGSGISSGVYFYSILANSTDGKQSFRVTKKMILLK